MIIWKRIKGIFSRVRSGVRKRGNRTMTWQEAKAIFEKEMPELTVTMVVDYDRRHYFIEAVEDPDDEEGEFDPYYAVDKKTKKVCSMNVTYDLEKAFECVEKRLKYRLS